MKLSLKTWSWKQILILVVGIICVAAIGCQPLINEIWPVVTNKDAERYLFNDPNATRRLRSMVKAEEMREDIMTQHRDYLLSLQRGIEDEDLAFQDAMKIDDRIRESQVYQDWLIGDTTNPLSVASLLAGTGFAGLIGYKIKRKGDSTPEEVDVKVAKAVDEEKKKNGAGTTGSGGGMRKA